MRASSWFRNGQQRGAQRYRCCDCSKYFSDHTCTPLRGTHHPDKWLPFIECMVNGYSLRRIAKLLDIAVSTAFTWRHKVLEAIKRHAPDRLEGITGG